MRTNLVKKKKDTKSPLNDSMLDMVIAFDTTGSMNAYIEAVKLQVKELIPKLFKQNPDLRIGIVAFGDYCDMPSKDRFGKAYQVCELTDNENRLIEFITKAQSTSGGDSDEFYELVIKKIVEETNWREGSTKAVLLIADAEPHRVGYSYNDRVVNNQIDWREEAKKAAEKGIKFDTLTINKTGWYKELSSTTEVKKDNIVFEHLESKKTISLSNEYVHNMLNTSDQYEIEVKVTREDKKDGTPGIRTIFENIKSSKVFTVVFKKQDKPKTKRQFESERESQRAEAIALIDKAKRQKKSMAVAYKGALEFIQNNPVKDYIEGEDRVLRGYKMQFVSRDGKYKCMDMDIKRTGKETGERYVNINTISHLIYNGVKYVVE